MDRSPRWLAIATLFGTVDTSKSKSEAHMVKRDANSDAIDLHIGKQIRRRRRLLGLTQQQLAEETGIGFQQVHKYETGRRIAASKLYKLAAALRVPVNYFFEGLPIEVHAASATSRDELNSQLDHVLEQKDARDLIRAYYSLGENLRKKILDFATSQQAANDEEPSNE